MGLFRIIFSILRARPATVRRPRQISTTKVVYQERVTYQQREVSAPVSGVLLRGYCHVIDGDTIVIGKTRIRLAGIDAPELDHPWGQKAKWEVVHMCKGQIITAHFDGSASHDRAVATCRLPDGTDIAAELVKRGLALDWAKFSGGKYLSLEPPDARRRLWRASNRQKGRSN